MYQPAGDFTAVLDGLASILCAAFANQAKGTQADFYVATNGRDN